MKKNNMQKVWLITVLGIIAALVLISGCSEKKQPLSERHPTDKLFTYPESEFESEKTLKCDINNVIYYEKGHFIYHINNIGDELAYSPVGIYTMYKDSIRWSLQPYNNKDNSIYLNTKKWLDEKKQPNNRPIECVYTITIPQKFYEFYNVHEKFYANFTYD